MRSGVPSCASTPTIRLISQPAAGVYVLGAHCACDRQLGSSRATARIYCGGVQAAEIGPKELPFSGAFWEVASVVWPGCAITVLDQTRTVTQGCTETP
jgi:hypothetical protein